ncbi:FAD-dependent oxidoreductase [Bacillus canaveralius]|uniref:FAD-dependent oxidoreductase n=1 Tax=Bacillus canaveralius TaxID=1403243 RepID=A0A2N5GJ82_9BACI|nr:FAD-dependent oxidoreductase [Bacillus canaveralius]PLR81172.1 FAD-dependent oxidoreductase [Bacillus canaveralius]PLR95853.1 FAD-dependent oxidoreductase [Bacillus canaveralius]RSK50541.1 FAD-dependent oxidoreductase [Bacillus canaveralius]
MEQKKIVIIGAGIVGCSTAYYLNKMGHGDITVIEQGPLFETGGSTSHAPGLVFQISFSKVLTTLASQTVEAFKELSSDGHPSFYSVGSLELAETAERFEDLKRKAGIGKSWGMEAFVLSPEACARKFPSINTDNLYGGLYVPSDGIAKPLRAVDIMANFAKSCGTKFYGHTEVTGIQVVDGQVKTVETSIGRFETDLIICCAGFWGPRIGEMVGVTIPLQPMAHQYVLTNDLPELASETEEVTSPLIRHQDSSMYYRQVFNGIGIGSYQHRPLPVEVSEIIKKGEAKEMPSVKPFTHEDFEKPWQDALELIPSLTKAGIKKGINGIFSFTPDGMPLLGESQKVRGFWVAEAIWVTHSAGVGKAMAEWIVNGAPTLDLELCDINRFDTYAQSPGYYKKRSIENYEKVYDIHHPYMPPETSRNVRVSPYYLRQKSLGAYFNEKSGWEQPQWYESNERLVETYETSILRRKGWAAEFWSPIIEAEQLHTCRYAGMYDATASKKRLEISGEGALDFLQKMTTNNVDIPIGHVTSTLMLHELAGIKDEIRVVRTATSTFFVLCTGAVEASWIKKQLSVSSKIVIQDRTAGMCGLGVIGDKAIQIMHSLDPDNFAISKWEIGRAQELYIGNVSVLAVYDYYVGTAGWEFFTTCDQGLQLWDMLLEAGRQHQLIALGDRALEGLRIESFVTRSGKDFWSEHDPFQVGLGYMVDFNKPTFIGKEALIQRKARESRLKLTMLLLEDPSMVVMGYEPVLNEDKVAGFITSAGYVYSLGKGIVYALLSPEVVREGNTLSIEYFGKRYKVNIMNPSEVIVRS